MNDGRKGNACENIQKLESLANFFHHSNDSIRSLKSNINFFSSRLIYTAMWLSARSRSLHPWLLHFGFSFITNFYFNSNSALHDLVQMLSMRQSVLASSTNMKVRLSMLRLRRVFRIANQQGFYENC